MKRYTALFVFFIIIFSLTTIYTSAQQSPKKITKELIPNAEKIIGLEFTDAQRDSMTDELNDQLNNYENIKKYILITVPLLRFYLTLFRKDLSLIKSRSL
jgi:preprotein translocase subunit SecY